MTRDGAPGPSVARSGWGRREKEIIFRKLGGGQLPEDDRAAAPPPPRAREAVPARRPRPRLTARLTARAAALLVLASALLAFIVGALTADRSGAPAPRVATRPAADPPAPPPVAAPTRSEPIEPPPMPAAGDGGEAVVRAFYDALGRGDGATASAQVVPEKRDRRAFSPREITRFYGALPEPLRLTAVTPLAPGSYRVRYRYAAGRSPCDGEAVVTLASRDGRDLIRSIRALNGC